MADAAISAELARGYAAQVQRQPARGMTVDRSFLSEVLTVLRMCEQTHGDGHTAARAEVCAQILDAMLEARFPNVSCSHCGQSFGPGDSGFSHCDDHAGLRGVR